MARQHEEEARQIWPTEVVADGWLQRLDRRHANVRPILLPTPPLDADECEWARTGALPAAPGVWPSVADVTRDPMQGALRRMPWNAPVWNAGVDGDQFVPGFVRLHVDFWNDIILQDHPLRDTLVSYLRDGVNLHDFLHSEYQGPSTDCPYDTGRFPGEVFENRIPPTFTGFVDAEVQALVDRGCVAKWADVRGPGGPPRPRLVMALSVEETKPRLVYDARPLNKRCKKVHCSMDTVARVAYVASQGCYMTSLDDSSAFHHILLRPSSWPLFGFSHGGIDYCWCVLPFGFSQSSWCYHTLSEAKTAYLRSKGISALAHLDHSWFSNFPASRGQAAREQWLAAGEATHVAMLVSFLCGQFLSAKKCDLRPTRLQEYLGMLCDSDTATFRVPQDKLDKLQQLLRAALDEGQVSFLTLQRIAGKCMDMTVAIRPASLWTRAMFSVIIDLEKSGLCTVDLTQDSRADLVCDFKQWLGVTATSQEGPWQRARHFTAGLTKGSSDAQSVAWGGAVNTASGTFPEGGVFPPDWVSKHISQKEMYGLYYLLRKFCTRHPDVLRRAQVLIDVENESVVGSFNRGRAKHRETHALLLQLFELQVEYGFVLSLKRNGAADATLRPSRDAVIRIAPAAFKAIWEEIGPFNVDLMACTASVVRSPLSGEALPFFSQYDCAGSAGTDVLAHDVSIVPGAGVPAFGFCFPPPVMAGHVVQHLAECKAHAVVLLPDVKAYWFPLVQLATVRSIEVAPVAGEGCFQWPRSDGCLTNWRYSRYGMIAYEVDFRSMGQR
ncbi:unnamed protein product [Laminaria digitata]